VVPWISIDEQHWLRYAEAAQMKKCWRFLFGTMLAAGLQANDGLAVGLEEQQQIKLYKQFLAQVLPSELPPAAANLVRKAKADEQEKVALAVVKAAISMNPAATAAVVGAIARVAPATAPKVAGTAAALQPKLAGAIARAARSAAPEYADRINKAMAELSKTASAGDPQSQALLTAQRANAAATAPIFGPPFTPGGGSPGEITLSQTVEVPPGTGRTYSSP